jgi:thiamine-monophosphate kinase
LPLDLWERCLKLDVHAAIDTSDGLSSEAHHISVQSRVKLILDQNALKPTPEFAEAARKLDQDPWDWILHGGEDHALLLSVPAKSAWNLPMGARVVGRVEDGKGVLLEEPGGKRRRLVAKGWVHG